MTAVGIRVCTPSDRDMLQALFERAGEGSPLETLWGHPLSEADIYLWPYLDREPSSVFVAELDGEPVGYLTGCVDSSSFPSEEHRLNQAISRYRLYLHPRPMAFFARATVDLIIATLRGQPTAGELQDPLWPSHLHINVERRARGTGAADALMEAWHERLARSGSPGCHLQTLRENVRARAFFSRHGYADHGTEAVVPGVRYQNRRVHQRTMVRSCAEPAST